MAASKKQALGYTIEAEKAIRQRDSSRALSAIGRCKTEIGGLREPAPPAPEPPQPDGRVLFNGAKISDFPGKQAASGAITEVKDPLGSGKTVFKFTVHDRDVAPITPTENPRAQLETPTFVTPGLEFWFRSKLLIPEDFPKFTGWLTLFAVYGPPFAGSGPWHIAASERGTELAWEEHERSFSIPLERGRWIDIMQHGLFSENGWLEIYVDGALAMSKTPAALRNRTNNGGNNNVRIAQYRQKGMFEVGTVYWDQLIAGTTRASVGG
jgi:hypothetical protein